MIFLLFEELLHSIIDSPWQGVILLVKIVGEAPPDLVKQVLVPSSFLGMELVGLCVVGDHLGLVELFLE